jgi:hypothetical protein
MSTDKTKQAADTVASEKENAKLEHSEGGSTTRDDLLDAGVPMLPGSPDEPVGPEDALGAGPKRGDYTGRVGPADYQPHQSVPIPDAQPGEATMRLVAQRGRAAERGDEAGVKGGVGTA